MANKQIRDFEEVEVINENDILLIQTENGYTRKIKSKFLNIESTITDEEYSQLENEIFGTK